MSDNLTRHNNHIQSIPGAYGGFLTYPVAARLMPSVGFQKMERDTQKYFKHLLAHLPIVKDPTLVILRGHLLVEELLDEVIKAWLEDPSVLPDIRLTFHQKLKLSKGIISGGEVEFTWKSLDLLNQLRNRISHRLSTHDLELKIDEFLKFVYPEHYSEIPSNIYSKSKAMRKAIIFHCAFLSGRIEVLKLLRDKQIQQSLSVDAKKRYA